jgi:Cof subfamily protein (haloacid dehalogenase superfamily)
MLYTHRGGTIMAIRLFITDLDGTLLDKKHRISAENKKAIQEAVAQGTIVTIATGRMYISALPYAKQLEVDVPIITYNGALIKSVSGKVLFESYLKPQDVKDVLTYCLKKKWFIQIYKDDKLYFAEHSAKACAYEELAGIKGETVGAEGLYEKTEHVPKMLVITSGAEETDKVVAELREAFGARVFPVKSNPNYAEIISIGVNKATALEKLLPKLGLKREETMAIGDSNNDLPMLKAAGYSVAMGNANDKVKAVCNYETADCANDGVAAAIRKYVLK